MPSQIGKPANAPSTKIICWEFSQGSALAFRAFLERRFNILPLTVSVALSTCHPPQIHCRIRAPRTPWLGSPLDFARAIQRQSAHQSQIAGRKSIRFTQGAHRDILCCPRSDPRNLAETTQEFVRVDNTLELDFAAAHRTRQRTNRLSACAR